MKKRYEKYKESGIQWLGVIPEHWKSVKIRRLTSVNRGASPRPIDDPIYFDDNGEYGWVRIKDVTASERYLTQTEEKLSELGATRSVKLEPGQLFLSIAGSVGKPIINKVKCCIHDGFVYFPRLKINPEYLYYIFTTGELYKGLGKLGTQLNLNTDTVGDIVIPIPTESEIELIVKFLDYKCTIIDDLISKKERLIERLQELRQSTINEAVTKGLDPKAKMKESGIEWLGAIPVQWNTYRLKYLVELNSNEVTTDESSTVFKVALENIESFSGKFIKSQDHVDFQGIGNNFKRGDVLFNKLRPYLAKVFLAESEGISVGELLVLSPKSNIHPRFLFYRLLSPSFIETVNSSTYGAKMPRASWNFISNLLIPIPSLTEQIQISNCLDNQLQRHEILTQKLRTQIDGLKEYRQSLISEAVTGKIDVREWQPSI